MTICAATMQADISVVPTGTSVDVNVEHNEDIGRTGFSGLLAELDAQPAPPVESPEAWAPVAVSHGAADHHHRSAVQAFCMWIDHGRHERIAS